MEQFGWVERYRPHTVEACILPVEMKTIFQEIVNKAGIPNLILYGKSGTGKTTVCKAICEELDFSYLVINASNEGTIDVLRSKITDFASTMSFDGSRKAIILDEADNLSNATQLALRSFTEEHALNVAFLYTCNTLNRINPALHSRTAIIEFKTPKEEKDVLMKQFFKRLRQMLEAESIPCEDPSVLAKLIVKYWPDMRRTINELQKYSLLGKIDGGILEAIKDPSIADLLKFIKNRNFKDMRIWCAINHENDSVPVIRKLYDCAYEVFEKDSIPDIVVLMGQYQYQAAFVVDHEIHLTAFLTELMQIAKFNLI